MSIQRITAVVAKDEQTGLYVARALEVDVASQGANPTEAFANLKEAVELFYEDQPGAAIPQLAMKTMDINVPDKA